MAQVHAEIAVLRDFIRIHVLEPEITFAQASKEYGIHERSISRAFREGKLQARKINRTTCKVRRGEILRYIEETDPEVARTRAQREKELRERAIAGYVRARTERPARQAPRLDYDSEIESALARYARSLEPEERQHVLLVIEHIGRDARGNRRKAKVRFEMLEKMESYPIPMLADGCRRFIEDGGIQKSWGFTALIEILEGPARRWYDGVLLQGDRQ